MPSERAVMPLETHDYLLRCGESKGLPLMAYEVAEFAPNNFCYALGGVGNAVRYLIQSVFKGRNNGG